MFNYDEAYKKGNDFLTKYAKNLGIELFCIVEDSYEYEHGLMLLSYDHCKNEYLNQEDCDSELELCIDLENIDNIIEQDEINIDIETGTLQDERDEI